MNTDANLNPRKALGLKQKQHNWLRILSEISVLWESTYIHYFFGSSFFSSGFGVGSLNCK
jgi:hypothetical protein